MHFYREIKIPIPLGKILNFVWLFHYNTPQLLLQVFFYNSVFYVHTLNQCFLYLVRHFSQPLCELLTKIPLQMNGRRLIHLRKFVRTAFFFDTVGTNEKRLRRLSRNCKQLQLSKNRKGIASDSESTACSRRKKRNFAVCGRRPRLRLWKPQAF